MLQYALMTESIEYRGEDLFSLSHAVSDARFMSQANSALDDYMAAGGDTPEGRAFLRARMLNSIRYPRQYPRDLISPETTPDIVRNQDQVRGVMEERVTRLNVFSSGEEVRDLIGGQHDLLKIAQKRWLLANPRMMLEFRQAGNAIPSIQQWLQEDCGVSSTDEVIWPHIVGGKSARLLADIGFRFPYDYLDSRYMDDSMKQSRDLVLRSSAKGIAVVSWIADPKIFENASDGRPLVGFAPFPITGVSKNFGPATPENGLSVYYRFATENERRESLVRSGEYIPKVFGIFLSRDEIAAAA